MSLQDRKSSRYGLKLLEPIDFNISQPTIGFIAVFFLCHHAMSFLHMTSAIKPPLNFDCCHCWLLVVGVVVIIKEIWKVIRIKTYQRNFFSCCTKINKRNVYKVSAKANGYSLFLKCVLRTKRYNLTQFRILQQLVVKEKKE